MNNLTIINIIVIASCVAYWHEYDRPAQRHFNNNKHDKKNGLALTSHWNQSIVPYSRPPRAQKWSQNLHEFWPRNLNAL